jgi:taurine dioxygenase
VSAVTNLTLERVTGNIGAIVNGVDVHTPADDATVSMLQRSLHEHGVLFFHSDSPISGDEFHTFACAFGEPFRYPYGNGQGGPYVTEDSTGAVMDRTNVWHTDGSPQERPPQAALLAAVELPSFGGDTMWASMYAAWDGLSSRLQRMLDGMEAVHNTDMVSRHYDESRRGRFGAGERRAHPVVITDPITRRQALYVNSGYTERLVGVSDRESARILDLLFQHVNTPEFHVRLRWQPNTIAVWEERVTQHRAVADYTERRALLRITIVGDEPPR